MTDDSDNEVLKGLEKLDKEIDAYIAIKRKMEQNFCDSKKVDETQERAFQIELSKIGQGMDVCGSIIGVIASVFVAIITTTLTLIVTLPSSVIGISQIIIAYEIGVAIVTLLASWWIIVYFRNRRIKTVKKLFNIPELEK
jgi:hypothetical protein